MNKPKKALLEVGIEFSNRIFRTLIPIDMERYITGGMTWAIKDGFHVVAYSTMLIDLTNGYTWKDRYGREDLGVDELRDIFSSLPLTDFEKVLEAFESWKTSLAS